MGKFTMNGYCHPINRPGFRGPWRRFRKAWLARKPLCAKCGRIGTQLDHVKPLHRIAPWDQITKRQLFDERNIQTLCKPCHDAKSATENAYKTPPKFCDCGLPWDAGKPICGKPACQTIPE